MKGFEGTGIEERETRRWKLARGRGAAEAEARGRGLRSGRGGGWGAAEVERPV